MLLTIKFFDVFRECLVLWTLYFTRFFIYYCVSLSLTDFLNNSLFKGEFGPSVIFLELSQELQSFFINQVAFRLSFYNAIWNIWYDLSKYNF